MVQKYRRQIQSSGIGVIRADMSVANDLGRTAQVFTNLSNQAFQIAGRKAQEKGREFISSLDDDEIFGLDENNKPVNLVDNLVTALPAKGYGMTSQAVIKDELRRRFSSIVSQKLEQQGSKYSALFPNNPKKFEEQMGEFINELAAPYSGEYKAMIGSQGSKYVSGVASRLQVQMINNRIRVGNLQLAEDFEKHKLNLNSIASGSSADTVLELIKSLDTDEHHQGLLNRATASREVRGGITVSAEKLDTDLKAELAVSQITRQLKKLLSSPKASDQMKAYKLNLQMTENLNVDPDPSSAPDSIDRKIAQLAKIAAESPNGEVLFRQQASNIFVAQNRLNTFEAQTLSNMIDTSVDALDDEQARLNTELNSLLNPFSPRSKAYQASLVSALRNNDPEAFLGTIAEMNNILTDANQKLTTTVDGRTVTSTSRVLQEGRSEKIQGQLQKQAVTIAKKFILDKFGTTGMYEKDKLEGIRNMLINEKGAVALAKKLNFTEDQMQVLNMLPAIRGKAVGPAGQETDFLPGMTDAFKVALNTAIDQAINVQDGLDNAQKENIKWAGVNESLANGQPIMGDHPDLGKFLDNKIIGDFQFKNREELLKAIVSDQFLPGKPLYKAISDMMLINGKIPDAIKTITESILDGSIPQGDFRGIEQFWRSSEQPNLFLDKGADGSISLRAVKQSRLIDQIAIKDLDMIRDILATVEVEGGDIFQIARQFAAFKNDPEAYGQMLDAMFPNADQNDRESSLFKAVEKIPEIKSSGGKGSPFYKRIVRALPYYLYQNRNRQGFTGDQDDINAWAKQLFTNLYPPTEDYVIDVFGVGMTLGSPEYRSMFALGRLLPDPKMKELFLEFANQRIGQYGNFSLTDSSADRGMLDGEEQGGTIFSFFSTPNDRTQNMRKVWLAPDHASSNAPFLELENGLPAGRDIFFTFVTGDQGDVKYMIGGPDDNKELIRISMREFYQYAASVGAFGNMIEP